MKSPLARRFAEVNKEWWVLLSLLVIAGVLNVLSYQNQMLLGLYTLPTLFSAYFYGRRHATMTALASVALVAILYALGMPSWLAQSTWYEVTVWGALLLVVGYAVGTLFRELHETYRGILLILEHLITRDVTAHGHAVRVSDYAAAIAVEMNLKEDLVEDIRKTALLHDVSKLGISKEIMRKTEQIMAQTEQNHLKHDDPNVRTLAVLKRVVPILMAGQNGSSKETPERKTAAQIIAVADEYEMLTSNRDSRKPLNLTAARKIITRNGGTKFDVKVVDAFLEALDNGTIVVEPIEKLATQPVLPRAGSYSFPRQVM
jgi:hypothetical protein